MVWIILNVIYSKANISCTLVEQASIINSSTLLGNFIIAINSLIELLPHILLPIAMYVIPAPRVSTQHSHVDLSEGAYEQIEDIKIDEDDGRRVRKKLSMLMSNVN
jgi:hypothetical protein